MSIYKFMITAPATVSAVVSIEAGSLQEAHEIAVSPAFYNDPDVATFALDDGNPLQEVYIPDVTDYEIVNPDEPPSADSNTLREFWRNSEMVNAFFDAFAVGSNPSGAVFDGRRIAIANGDRNLIAIISTHAGYYNVVTTKDPLLLADPEAETQPIIQTKDVVEAFRVATAALGHDIDDALTNNPAP